MINKATLSRQFSMYKNLYLDNNYSKEKQYFLKLTSITF